LGGLGSNFKTPRVNREPGSAYRRRAPFGQGAGMTPDLSCSTRPWPALAGNGIRPAVHADARARQDIRVVEAGRSSGDGRGCRGAWQARGGLRTGSWALAPRVSQGEPLHLRAGEVQRTAGHRPIGAPCTGEGLEGEAWKWGPAVVDAKPAKKTKLLHSNSLPTSIIEFSSPFGLTK